MSNKQERTAGKLITLGNDIHETKLSGKYIKCRKFQKRTQDKKIRIAGLKESGIGAWNGLLKD